MDDIETFFGGELYETYASATDKPLSEATTDPWKWDGRTGSPLGANGAPRGYFRWPALGHVITRAGEF